MSDRTMGETAYLEGLLARARGEVSELRPKAVPYFAPEHVTAEAAVPEVTEVEGVFAPMPAPAPRPGPRPEPYRPAPPAAPALAPPPTPPTPHPQESQSVLERLMPAESSARLPPLAPPTSAGDEPIAEPRVALPAAAAAPSPEVPAAAAARRVPARSSYVPIGDLARVIARLEPGPVVEPGTRSTGDSRSESDARLMPSVPLPPVTSAEAAPRVEQAPESLEPLIVQIRELVIAPEPAPAPRREPPLKPAENRASWQPILSLSDYRGQRQRRER